jgi:Flp pilus assembly protein TadG
MMIIPARQKGAAAVEFAILVPFMILMALGVTELGRAFYQYNTLTKSLRDGVRYLSTQAPGTGHGTAACLVVHGNQDCSGGVLVPGLSTSMVSVCDAINCAGTHSAVSTGTGVVNLVTVTVTGYTFDSFINFQMGGLTIGVPDLTFPPIGTTMRQAL